MAMKLFSKFKNLFVPKEEDKPGRKAVKKAKKKLKKKTRVRAKKKVLKKRKKVSKTKKKVVKKKSKLKKKINKRIKKKIGKKVKNKTGSKVKKKPAKKRLPKKKLPRRLKEAPGEKEIGIVVHYFGKISVGIIKLKSTLRLGERIHIKGMHDNFAQTVKSMQINHEDVSIAGKGSEVGIKVPQSVHENDKVYKV